jgi:CHAD domain-containing protein
MTDLPATTGALAIEILKQQSARFLDLAPGARSGHDTEAVHQMRVAARRMRAALRLFSDVLPKVEATHLNGELKWIASLLGHARDLDVQLSRFDELAARLDLAGALAPYKAWLEEQRREAQVALEDALRSPRFMELVQVLRGLDTWPLDPLTDAPVLEDAPRRLARAFKALRKRARKLTVDSPAPEFHKTRIRAKRLRYAAEFFTPAYGKPAERLVKRLVALQDLLGDLQDGVVAEQRIRTAVDMVGSNWPPTTTLALGQVLAENAKRAEKLRRQFRKIYDEVAGKAWSRLESKVAMS